MSQEFDKFCYDLYYGDLEINKFEKWVYESSKLESLISSDQYLELISLNYQSRDIKHQIEKILKNHIDYGYLEKKRIIEQLNKSLQSREALPQILQWFYYMYCHGYYFLFDIGIGYGLTCVVPPSKYKVETWEELNQEEKDQIIESFYPQIESDIYRALSWIKEDKIVLTGTKDDMNRWEFIDNRTDEEKISTILKES
ncbi:MAG: hypothetical protein WCL54_03820 [Clostridia bacterium]